MQGSSLEGTDVLVVGAGIVGTATAYFLARAGVEVCVVDRYDPGTQASGRNAGSLHLQMSSTDAKVVEGADALVASLRFLAGGVETWKELSTSLDRDIELAITGGLMVAETDDQLRFLEHKAKRERAQGLEIHMLTRTELRTMAPYVSERLVGAAYCPGEGRINPLGAVASLARGAQRAGARILGGAELLALDRRGGRFQAVTGRGALACHRVVNAAGAWSPAVAAMAGARLPVAPTVLQLLVAERSAPLIEHLVQHADAPLTPKQSASGTLIIGGGWPATDSPHYGHRGHYAAALDSIVGNLRIALDVVPALAGKRLIRTWTGVNCDAEGAPILGAVPGIEGFHVAVGPPSGYTAGPYLGRLMAESLATGRAIYTNSG